MKTVFWSFVIWSVLCVSNARGESILSQIQKELISTWLVTVDGDVRTRTLRIKGVEAAGERTFMLQAEYGFSDRRQSAVRAHLEQSREERKLLLTTQTDATITATQDSRGVFNGTFVLKNGRTNPVTIEKISESELQARIDGYVNASAAVESMLIGAYKGSFTALVSGAGFINVGLEINIDHAAQGRIRGHGIYYAKSCRDKFPVDGIYRGNQIRIRSASKFGPVGDCSISLNLTIDGNRLVGHTGGPGYPVHLLK
jgi:hypothetical protein